MTILGNRNDWTFISSPGYNNLNIESDILDVRPGSTGTRSLLAPISTLAASEYAQAVLSGQPSVVVSGATLLLWFRPEELTGLDHETYIGIRDNLLLTTGYRVVYKHLETPDNYITFGLETIVDDTIRLRSAIPITDPLAWKNIRLSTSDVNSNPTILVEILDGGIYRKRGYFVDHSGNILVGATGSYSFGLKQGTSPGTNGSRFDDLEVFIFPLNVTTPLPYTNGFESGAWGNDYLQLAANDTVVGSIQVTARPGSTGLASLKVNNTNTITESGSLYLGISDGINYQSELWMTFTDTETPVEVSLKTIEDSAGLKSAYVLRILPATDELKIVRRDAGVDTELETYLLLPTSPIMPCSPPADPLGQAGIWYGFKFSVENNLGDVDYVLDVNIHNNGWNNLFTGTDAASTLATQEGSMVVNFSIETTGSIYFDDLKLETI